MRHIAIALALTCIFQITLSRSHANAAPATKVKESKETLQKKIDPKENSALKQDAGVKKNTGEALESRIDFGNSYILGQTIKSGAVYLLQRKKSEIKSMLKQRKDYRKEILEDFHITDMKTDNQ